MTRSHPPAARVSDPARTRPRTMCPRRSSSADRRRPMKPLAPVRNTVCGTALLLILDHFLQSLQVGLDFLGGVLNLHGVVDHAGGQEDYQLGPRFAVVLRAERGAQD